MPNSADHILFPHFLSDASEYEKCRQFWADLWDDIAIPGKAEHNWRTDWVSTGGPNIRDGNPIFSAVSTQEAKGIRVIQDAPHPDSPEFTFWQDTVGGEITDPEAVDELVIACVLNRRTADRTKALMACWIRGSIVVESRKPAGDLSYFSDHVISAFEPMRAVRVA